MGSILDALEHGAAEHPDKPLYTFLDGSGRVRDTYTYAAFHERTRHLAQHLRVEKSLRRGDRVLLVYPPGLELIVAFVACARIGVIPVPVYPPTPMSFESALAKLAFVARDCEATAALTTRGFHRSYRLLLAKRRITALWLRTPPLPALRWITTDDARGVASNGFANDPGPVLFLQYTSGSTNDPKGVVVSHDNVLHNCASALDFVPTFVSWLPQYHDMGLIGYSLCPFLTGGTAYGFSPLDFLKRPALWLETISRVRASHTASPNFGYAYCLREDKLPSTALSGLDLSSLRIMMNAAEPVVPETQACFLERFAPYGLRPEALIAAYGLAENTIAVAQHGRRSVCVNKKLLQQRTLHIEDPHPGNNNQLSLMSCGRPLQGVEVRIVDPDTRSTLGEHRIGEIWTSGASTCSGYWNRPELSREVFGALRADDPDGRGHLRTGDLGFFHEGELYVCGRIKDIIIIRGVNYYPQDIEAIVERCSKGIRAGRTVAFDAGEDGSGLVVLIEVKDRVDLPDAAEIARAIRTQYYIEPHTIAFVPHRAIPKTTSGKLSRNRAKQEWQAGALRVIATYHGERDREPAGEPTGLRQRFQYIVELYNLTGDEPYSFAEIGIDSLTTVELLADLKELLEEHGAGSLVEVVDVRLLQGLTIAEFFALLDQFEQASDEPITALRRVLQRVAEEHSSYERECMRSDAALPVAPGCEPAGREAELTDVLLTGATGFLGPFLLSSLLRETPFTFHTLIRAPDPAAGMERIRAALRHARLLTPSLAEALETRVRAVPGDLARHDLGLPSEGWRALSTRVQAVFHSAAHVNYVASYDALKPHNVDGTRELIRFAFTGAPKAFHFVSSTFIYGWTVKNLLLESDDNAAMENLDFGYAQSKWVAEQMLFAAEKRGLKLRVYRPSLISASAEGVGSKDDIGIRLLTFMITHGVAVDAKNQISFLPADTAAHNIVTLFAQRDLPGTTFHVTVDEYYNLADVAREITRSHGYPFTYYSIPEFVAEMNRRSGKDDPIYPLLDFFNRSHPKIAAMSHKRYSNDGYRRARDLSGTGRNDPSLAATVAYLMTFVKREGLVPPPPQASRNPR
jgi:thioester reductase-like protein